MWSTTEVNERTTPGDNGSEGGDRYMRCLPVHCGCGRGHSLLDKAALELVVLKGEQGK